MLPPTADAARLAAQRTLAADPNVVGELRRAARTGDRDGIEATARSFEALLLGQMLKQMRAASGGGGLLDSEQSALYTELYDQESARLISNGQGVGLRPALMRQLGARDNPAPLDQPLRMPERNPWLLPMRRAPRPEASSAVAPAAPNGTTAAPSSTAIPDNAEAFVRAMQPHAEAAGRALGFDPLVLLAQSALETGWGRRIPRRADGSSSHNLFGIKADSRWEGERVAVGTVEFRDGVAQREQARFRVYGSPAESFADYVAFLRRNPRYREALSSGDSRAFMQGLQRAGYATDPGYAAKVLSIYDRLRTTLATVQDSMRGADKIIGA